MKKAKGKEKSTEQITDAIMAAKPLTTLAEIQAACQKLLALEFVLDPVIDPESNLAVPGTGQPVRIELRRMTPAEEASLDAILSAILPPISRGKTMEEDRPDFSNADYVKRKTTAEIETRALGLYWCVPMFQQSKPGLVATKDIVEFIQGQLNAQILNVLWQAIRSGGVKLAELVNFT